MSSQPGPDVVAVGQHGVHVPGPATPVPGLVARRAVDCVSSGQPAGSDPGRGGQGGRCHQVRGGPRRGATAITGRRRMSLASWRVAQVPAWTGIGPSPPCREDGRHRDVPPATRSSAPPRPGFVAVVQHGVGPHGFPRDAGRGLGRGPTSQGRPVAGLVARRAGDCVDGIAMSRRSAPKMLTFSDVSRPQARRAASAPTRRAGAWRAPGQSCRWPRGRWMGGIGDVPPATRSSAPPRPGFVAVVQHVLGPAPHPGARTVLAESMIAARSVCPASAWRVQCQSERERRG